MSPTAQKAPAKKAAPTKRVPAKKAPAKKAAAPTQGGNNLTTNRVLTGLARLATFVVGVALGLGVVAVIDNDDNGSTTIVRRVVERDVPSDNRNTPNNPSGQPAAQPAPASNQQFPLYDQAGGIPFPPASTWTADVAPDEIEVFTGGPMTVAGVRLTGGVDRGSVVLFLPDPNRVIPVQADGVISGANWHGAYRPLNSPRSESTWRSLANDRVSAMKQAPNCTSGKGCNVLDVLVVMDGRVIAQWQA